uniref:Uncharacterized protein n=1 Tax=Oryzias melastigma TaxID=30732 RepID=A0A3B3CS42_ORYME
NVVVSVLVVEWWTSSTLQDPGGFAGVHSSSLYGFYATPQSDDGSSPQITLQKPFFYFDQRYNSIYVNNNGHLTFTSSYWSYTPQRFPLYGSMDIIAPFWTDLNNAEGGSILYNQYTSGSVLQQATQDINIYFPNLSFSAECVFVATWYEVAYLGNPGSSVTFQAVLISGGQHSFLLMNYGVIDSTERTVQAGYDTINSYYHLTIPGSFSSSATGVNSTFSHGSNVNVTGRWAFQVDSGPRGCRFNGEPVQLGDSFWSDSSCTQKCTCTTTGLQCSNQPCSFSQVCMPNSFQFSCQTVHKRTCTISGDPHYYTFDNTVFHFQGTCTYVLSEQCQNGLPYYRVEGKNEHRGSTHVSWTRLVKVFVYDETIELVKGNPGRAKVDGSFTATPFSMNQGRVQVYQSGFSVVVSTDFGLTVSYDTYSHVGISLPYTYQNATCGLCGNFNNQPGDDFRTRQGEVVSSDVVFANSWRASGDDEPGCEPPCEGLECAGCNAAQTALYSNNEHCGILQNSSGPFAPCHQTLPPQNFVDSCVYDLCVGGGYQPILCQALNVYSSQCQQNGIQPESWRRPGFCEIPCPANSHFESQASGCPSTCVNPNSTQNCPLPVQESCVCDTGYVLSAGECVPHAECGCSFEGFYYQSGETVILGGDCGRCCSCTAGSMTCSPYSCGPHETCSVEDGERGCRPNGYATCWIRGAGSYQTFDGLTYQYPGACKLIVAKVVGSSDHPHFTVSTEKVPKGQDGFSNYLNIEVDGQLTVLPFSSGSNHIRIFHSNTHSIILRTSFGLTVQTVWPHFVRVTAPVVYSSSLGGLCGNYNNEPNDDFQTPNGILVHSSQVFGDSWREGSLASHCVENSNRNSMTNYSTSDYCGILRSPHGPFTSCWAVVEPSQQVDVCVDILRRSEDPESTLCEVLRDYALMCQQQGVSLGEWRNRTGCALTCPSNSHYELCGTSCPSACPSLSFPFSCDSPCQDGCQCNDGLVLNGNQCVPPTSCGCYHQGRYWQSGQQFWDGEECQSLCSCNGVTGVVNCEPHSCGPEEACRVVDGEFGCHPNPSGTCSASGDPHYLTFDGKTYDFQGTCRYVLAEVCHSSSGLHQFSVEAKNEPWNGLPVSITAEVAVSVWGYKVWMFSNNRVEVSTSVNKILVRIMTSDIQLTVVHLTPHIFRLQINHQLITMKKKWNMCGLCGNFNGNPNDDFHTPNGASVPTPDAFGASWKAPGNYTCSDGCGSSCPQCTNDQTARAQCEVLQAADGPFSFCHEQVDPAPFFSDCVFDVCVGGNARNDLLCRAIETYVSACQSANVRIYPWRQNTTCSINCPANSHYELCGTDCDHNCVTSTDATCEHVCSEGCFCDEGFVRSGTTCVPVESCGCQYEGFYYNVKSFWKDGCTELCGCFASGVQCVAASCAPAQQCTIKEGQLGCYDAMSTCTVWGDPHYITFDGALAHFQGTCSYIITETGSHGNNDTRFEVVATNNHRGNNYVSFVNGAEASLPTTAGALAQVSAQDGFVVFDAADLIVQFDGQSTLLVRMSKHYQNKVGGMCGNFNGDPSDDKVKPSGVLAQNDSEFGQSWKSQTNGHCRFSQEYSELCSIITNTSGPFSACHLHSDPQPFFSSCVYDLCLYSPANGMLCSAVSAYEKTCTVLGLTLSDPCEELDCAEHEWCGKKNGEYGCFCDEHHHRPNNESYDSSITCESSSGTMSVSRCQLFEAGFHSNALHLKDRSCNGTLQNGRLVFHFDNDGHLCGTVLMSNGTHFMYENTIQGDVDTHGIIISRQRNIHLRFSCSYPLSQALFEAFLCCLSYSVVRKKLPAGVGVYHMMMTPYQDAAFHYPFNSNTNIEMVVDERLYIEVRAEGVDQHQISTVLDSCWATPVNIANYPVRWNLIVEECPNPDDGTVELVENGISTVSRFSFKMFTFTNSSSIFIHCNVHLCLLRNNNCTAHCYPGHPTRFRRDLSYHDSSAISVGPLDLKPRTVGKTYISFSLLLHIMKSLTNLIFVNFFILQEESKAAVRQDR